MFVLDGIRVARTSIFKNFLKMVLERPFFPPVSLTQGRDPSPWSTVLRGFPQWISTARFRPREALILHVWHEGM
jgi:hypothetical protein